jgi:Fur family transcriptional regulator, ferric uptake regulator
MTPREIVHQALTYNPYFASAQLLHARMLIAGQSIGLNTVYRVLRELVDASKVDVIRGPGGGQLFRLRPGPRHSHYLFCRSCGYSIPIDSEFVEHWASTAGENHGFVDVEHTIELIGICADCAAPATKHTSH